MSSVAIARPRPLVLGDLIAVNRGQVAHAVRDVLLVIGAAGFVGALAQISIHLSFTPVPITGQTLGVLLAGTALGWRRAAASMALYAIAGMAGVAVVRGRDLWLRERLVRLHHRVLLRRDRVRLPGGPRR